MATVPTTHFLARFRVAGWPIAASLLALLLGWWLFALPPAYAAVAALAVVLAALAPPFGAAAASAPAGSGSERDGEIGLAAQAVLSALSHPAFLLDRAGTVRFANAEAAVQFAATRTGDPLTLTFRSPEVRAALETPDSPAVVEYREGGRSARIYAVSFGPISLPNEPGDWLLAIVEDASDRFAITRMRADFVANASHELRTPLASLTGFIETLLGPARNDPAATERFLRVMQDQASRMRRLIDDLLTLSRVEMGEHRAPTASVDLVTLLREVSDSLAATAAEHSVGIAVAAPDGSVTVRGVRDELFQVFGNLLENAIRYGGSGGRVDLTVGQAASGDVVTVRDYGPGIAPEHLPRLTERFYRVDVGASRSMKGTGLGLAIVKHILTRHGARLKVTSEPGQGAAFTVIFPTLQLSTEKPSWK